MTASSLKTNLLDARVLPIAGAEHLWWKDTKGEVVRNCSGFIMAAKIVAVWTELEEAKGTERVVKVAAVCSYDGSMKEFYLTCLCLVNP